MKNTTHEYGELAAKIRAALSQLDQKGTNEDVTRAMLIVYEAFQRHAAKRSFSASDLIRSAQWRMRVRP